MMMDFLALVDKHKMNITGVLHCGASEGQERDLYWSIGVKDVLWVEAIPSVYEKLVANLLDYPGNTAANACLSDKDGDEVEFNISNYGAQSSSFLEFGLHAQIHPGVDFVDKIKLRTTRLETILNDINTENINFGNFDLQGAELLALKGMGRYLELLDYIWIEVNMRETYKNCPLVGDIDEFLSEFTRVETGAWVGECWADALYIRKTLSKQ